MTKGSEFSFFVTNKYKWTLCASLALFFFVFMITFLPFGVSNYDPNHQYTFEFIGTMMTFMMATGIMAVINEFTLKPLIIRSVSVLGVLLWSIWLMVILGLTNFMLYNIYGEWHDFSLRSAIDFVLNCSAVFIFPVLGTLFYFRYQNLKKQYEHALTNNDNGTDPKQLLHFEGQGSGDKISIALGDFLYGKAQDNYVKLFYLQDQSISNHLIRMSMNDLIQNVDSSYLIRCHRSYMVNKFHVRAIKGNNPISIQINHISDPIQVSKSYKDEVLKILHSA